jgi:RecA/RadA recombinase
LEVSFFIIFHKGLEIMGLLDAIDKKFEEFDLGGEIIRPSYPTGVDNFDYMNGKLDTEGDLQLGVSGGKIFYIPGWSGSGKSTFAIQAAFNIIDPYEEGMMVVYDCEKSNSHERIAALSGMGKKKYAAEYKGRKVRLINDHTNTEGLYTLIDQIYRTKMEVIAGVSFNKDGSRTKNTKADVVREKATHDMPPTVIIVDSWANLAPCSMNDQDSARTSMQASMIAKANNGLIKGIMDKIYESNIILFIINHISKAISVGVVPVDMRPLKFLKQDETLPGGGTAVFNADTLCRMEQKKALKPDEGFGIKGFICEATMIKSRNNASGFSFNLVFDQYTGISNCLTNYNILKEANEVGGGGRGFFLKALPDLKFQQNTIVELYEENEEFKEVLDREARIILRKYILDLGSEVVGDEDVFNEEEEEDLTEDDVRSMKTKKELKTVIADYELEIDESEYGSIKELRMAIIDELFYEEEE